jgi:hypothetical protein
MSRPSSVYRRSVALSGDLVDAATAVAPSELKDNFNRLVATALEEYTARRKALEFEAAMERMAADPSVREESEAISREFRTAESDGLGV